MSDTVSIAKSLAHAHQNFLKDLSNVLKSGQADENYKSVMKNVLIKMADVEKVICESLHQDDMRNISSEIMSSNLADGSIDTYSINRYFDFVEPSSDISSFYPGDISEAAVFGLFVYSYSCCHNDKSGIFVGMGVGVKSCGDGYRYGGCL